MPYKGQRQTVRPSRPKASRREQPLTWLTPSASVTTQQLESQHPAKASSFPAAEPAHMLTEPAALETSVWFCLQEPTGLRTGLSPLVGIRTNKLLWVYPRAQNIVEIYSVVKPEETLKIASLLPSNTFLYQSLTCNVNCKSTLMVFSCRMPSCSLFSIARQLNG